MIDVGVADQVAAVAGLAHLVAEGFGDGVADRGVNVAVLDERRRGRRRGLWRHPGPNMPNLTYLTPFADLAAREKAWDAFAANPEWVKAREESIARRADRGGEQHYAAAGSGVFADAVEGRRGAVCLR